MASSTSNSKPSSAALPCLLLLLALITTSANAQGFMDDYDLVDMEPHHTLDISSLGKVAIAYLGKPFALLSLICSMVTINEIISSSADTDGNPTPISPTRQMISLMAVGSALVAFGTFLGTWPLPADSAYDDQILGNVGTIQACTFQGFVLQLGRLLSILSTTALSFYYLAVVRAGWTSEELSQIHSYVKAFLWVWALAASIYLIPMDLYNSSLGFCSIQSVPPDCSGDTCTRGRNPSPHQTFTLVLTILGLITSLSIAMSLYLKVRSIRKEHNVYELEIGSESLDEIEMSMPGSRLRRSRDETLNSLGEEIQKRLSMDRPAVPLGASLMNQRKSIALAWKGISYALAFLATYFFAFVAQAPSQMTENVHELWYFLGYLVFLPSAGTFNFMIFAKGRLQTPSANWLRRILFCQCCCGRPHAVPTSQQSLQTQGSSDDEEDSVVVFLSDGTERLFKKSKLFSILHEYSSRPLKNKQQNKGDPLFGGGGVEKQNNHKAVVGGDPLFGGGNNQKAVGGRDPLFGGGFEPDTDLDAGIVC